MPSKNPAPEQMPSTGMPLSILARNRKHTQMVVECVAHELAKAGCLFDAKGRPTADVNPSTNQATIEAYDAAFDKVAERSPEILAVLQQNDRLLSEHARMQKAIDDQRLAFRKALGFRMNGGN